MTLWCGLNHGCGRSTPTQSSSSQVFVASRTEASSERTPGALTLKVVLVNRGAVDLQLGPASTSCGCSGATVSPRVIAPGGRAIVRVEGNPPVFGVKPVSIFVRTNDPNQPKLTLSWDLIGHPTPPQLLTEPPVVNLGILRPDQHPPVVSVDFDILEDRDKPSFITGAVCSPGLGEVEGGIVDEVNTKDSRFVTRTYHYTTRFVDSPAVGVIFEHMTLQPTAGESRPWMTIPVQGTVLPVVRAIPTAVSWAASSGNDQDQTTKVMILCDDQSQDLKVECISHDPSLTVRRIQQQLDRVIFAVKHNGSATHTVRPIEFRVTQPVTTTLTVPIAPTVNH